LPQSRSSAAPLSNAHAWYVLRGARDIGFGGKLITDAMPRIDELSGAFMSDPHEETEHESAVAAAGVVAVGVDAQALAANISANELAVEDTRLFEMQNNAQIYVDDWQQQHDESLAQSWGWDDREAEDQIKVMCKDLLDEACPSPIIDPDKSCYAAIRSYR